METHLPRWKEHQEYCLSTPQIHGFLTCAEIKIEDDNDVRNIPRRVPSISVSPRTSSAAYCYIAAINNLPNNSPSNCTVEVDIFVW
jgi:hypothetical protein